MANLSQIRREKMLNFLEMLKEQHSDDVSLIAINQIEKALTSKKYGLVWEEHEEEVDIKMQTYIPVFKEVESKEIVGNPDSEQYNFLLEGDNLHSLKLLEKTHKGKIDVIYIDPPYNTGSKDFIYNDSIIDENDGYRHSKWLSFISKRLKLAKDLMNDMGMIMISINEIEVYSLKLLCDSIFGEMNYLSNMIWQSTPGSNTGLGIKTVTEYVLCYAKNKEKCCISSKPIVDDEKYVLQDEHLEKRGKYILNKLDRRMTGQHYSDALNYQIEMPDGQLLYPGSNLTKEENWNWRWSQNKVKWGIENDFIVFKKNRGKWSVYFKQYYKVDNNDNPINRSLPYQNLIKDLDGANSARGTQEVMDMFNKKAFDYPKPLNLIKYLLKIPAGQSVTVLDFFAGSGTTAQAVLELNSEDGKNRKFILCTNNDNSICEEVTYPRLKTVITGKRADGSKYSDGQKANLKYYKTDFVDKESEEIYDDLLKHITEMIQLQYGVKVDNQKYIMIMNDEEMDDFESSFHKHKDIEAVFINQDVLLTTSQEKLLQDINTKIIPDCYFDFELREIGELW
ncbi:MAG: site-specific DNA-methyltransferase [Lachnospiraceae bacterium]|jgi:adenine-specific DNA-methyltransferase|nr:site-specific DNA-methyltransferase [Lachnospiraceae bacterium]